MPPDVPSKVQSGMAEENAGVPQGKRIEFRIGIHVGDIIIDDNDIFGDGVNIAARLEGSRNAEAFADISIGRRSTFSDESVRAER